MGKYSLVQVTNRHNGYIDGTWLQNCVGVTEAEAHERARATERANSNRISVAVVHHMDGGMFWDCGGPNYNHYKSLRETIQEGKP